MKYTKLGNSELTVSAVTLGCMTFTGDANWGPQDEKDSIDTIRAALDAGITSFDTAEGYANGLTEEILAKALGKDREKVVIMSKVSGNHLAKADLIAACENSLKRMKTDYIDLYQIHWPNYDIPVSETMEALEILKEQGKIREIGVSNHGVGNLDEVLACGKVVSNQLAYNMLTRGIEYSIVPKCMENGIGILTYSSLAQGLLTGKYMTPDSFPIDRARFKIFDNVKRTKARHGLSGCEDEAFGAIAKIKAICDEIGENMADVALAWSLAQPGITSVIAGARTIEQAKTNAKGGNLELSADIISELTKITEPVKAYIGDDADPWAFGRIK